MKTKVIILFVLLSSGVLTGCAGKTVLLKNNIGEIEKCEVSTTWPVFARLIARNMAKDDCIKQYEAAGYKRIKLE